MTIGTILVKFDQLLKTFLNFYKKAAINYLHFRQYFSTEISKLFNTVFF